MGFQWDEELRRERAAFMQTMESLTDEQFERGTTLCAKWTPRDVLAHLIANDHIGRGVGLTSLTLNSVNQRGVDGYRELSREEITKIGWDCADHPTKLGLKLAKFFAGDVAIHHQDVLRPLGREREISPATADALWREGMIWSWILGAKLLRYRVVPTTPGGEVRGRGREVRGTTEALSMWLTGRKSVAADLEFA